MKQRLNYIDAIKGFAILLVVMGHVIPWSFSSFEVAQNMNPTPILLWKVIYSFHMPLFVFISGYLYGFSHYKTIKDYFSKLYKKAIMLIIPWFICGILIQKWRGGQEFTYWYLLTLFLLLAIVGFELFFIDKIKNIKAQILIEACVLGCTHLALQAIPHFIDNSFLHICDEWYPHLSGMFGYFAMGCFLMRHCDIRKLMNNYVYSFCLILFVSSFVYNRLSIHFLSISTTSLCAIYCCFYLFVICFHDGRIVNYFEKIGKKTLDIYILHLFFGIQIVQIGNFFISLSQASRMGFVSCFVLQLIFSLLASLLIIIEMSLFTSKIIKSSKILSLLLLGGKE